MGAEPGGEAGRGVSILSSSAGRVVSPPTPHRGVGEGVAPGGRGGAGRNGGGASPPPTQGPGTHLFHFLGREGDRVRGGPRGNPTHLPHPPQGPQSSGTRTGRGQSLPPNCEGAHLSNLLLSQLICGLAHCPSIWHASKLSLCFSQSLCTCWSCCLQTTLISEVGMFSFSRSASLLLV